jgi:hypothetical protein
MVGHEKLGSAVVMVTVVVEKLVVTWDTVMTSVLVSKGVHEGCDLARSTALLCASVAAVLLVLGGLYDSAHSSSSSSVAPCAFVTVIGGQLNSLASSGSSISVTVTRKSRTVVESTVVVDVSTTGGQAEQ